MKPITPLDAMAMTEEVRQRQAYRKSLLDGLVIRFLAWHLPESVSADPCATEREFYTKRGYASGATMRSGTNLLTADEARQMFEYVLASFELVPVKRIEDTVLPRPRTET